MTFVDAVLRRVGHDGRLQSITLGKSGNLPDASKFE